MTSASLLEVTRAIAYGGIGVVIGYALGLRVNDAHYLAHHPEDRGKMEPKRVDWFQRLAVIGAMLALLLTGLAMLQNRADERAEDLQRCEDLRNLVTILEARTEGQAEINELSDDNWAGIASLIKELSDGESPLLDRIEEYLNQRQRQTRVQEENEIDVNVLADC